MLVSIHVVKSFSYFLNSIQQLILVNKEPFSFSVMWVHLHNSAVLVHSVARIFEVLVEWGFEIVKDMVLLLIVQYLSSDSSPIGIDLSFRHTNFVQEYVRNITVFEFLDISLPLKNIDKSWRVSWTRLEHSEHSFYENSIHKAVHIENIQEWWKVVNVAPGFLRSIRNNWVFYDRLLFFSCVFDSSLLDLPEHSLVLSPVKYLQLRFAELIVVIIPFFV